MAARRAACLADQVSLTKPQNSHDPFGEPAMLPLPAEVVAQTSDRWVDSQSTISGDLV